MEINYQSYILAFQKESILLTMRRLRPAQGQKARLMQGTTTLGLWNRLANFPSSMNYTNIFSNVRKSYFGI